MIVALGAAFWRRPPRVLPMYRQVRSIGGCRVELVVRETRRCMFFSHSFLNWSCRDHLASIRTLQSRCKLSYSTFHPSPPPVFIVFDLETTGFDRKEDRIIEIAARDLRGGERGSMEALVNSRGRRVHPEAFRINQISDAMLRHAPGWDVVGPTFVEWVESRRVPGADIVLLAHNGFKFDVPFIKAEFERNGVPFPPHWQAGDTLLLLKYLYKSTPFREYKMAYLIPHFQVQVSGAQHRAMYDVDALSEVLSGAMKHHKMALPDALQAWGQVTGFGEERPEQKKGKKGVEKKLADPKWDAFAKGIVSF